jgi:hypothetical protein
MIDVAAVLILSVRTLIIVCPRCWMDCRLEVRDIKF